MYSETSLKLDNISDENYYQELIKYTNLKSLTLTYSTLCKLPLIPSIEVINVVDTFIVIPDNLPNLKYVKAELIESVYVNKDNYPNVIFDVNPNITNLLAYDVNDNDYTIIKNEYLLYKFNDKNFNEKNVYMFIIIMSERFLLDKIIEVLKNINDEHIIKFFNLIRRR